MHAQDNGALCQPQDLAWWKARNWNQKEVQMHTQAKQWNNVKTHAWVLHLRGNMQAEGGPDGCTEEPGATVEGDTGGKAQ